MTEKTLLQVKATAAMPPPGLSYQRHPRADETGTDLLLRWRMTVTLHLQETARAGWFMEVFHTPAGSAITIHLAMMDNQNCLPATLHLCPWDQDDLQLMTDLCDQDEMGLYFFRRDGSYLFGRTLMMSPLRQVRYRAILEEAIAHCRTLPPTDLIFKKAQAIKQQKQSAEKNTRIGEMLIGLGLLDQAGLEAAIQIQKQGEGATLGSILVKHNFCAVQEILMALQMQEAQRNQGVTLGVLLVQGGYLSDAKLQAALVQQQMNYLPLGQILIRSGACTEQMIEEALIQQRRLRYGQFLREFLPSPQ